jgi:hypothetical protein
MSWFDRLQIARAGRNFKGRMHATTKTLKWTVILTTWYQLSPYRAAKRYRKKVACEAPLRNLSTPPDSEG